MGDVKVYYTPLSQVSRAVVLFFKLNDIPFEDKKVDMAQGEHRSPEYKKINPFYTVPAIDDNGFKLAESVAILKYLCTKHNLEAKWYPSEIQTRARIDEYVAWQHSNTRHNEATYFRAKVFDENMMGRKLEEKREARLLRSLNRTLDHIDQVFLARSEYLSGPDITLADIFGICELIQLTIIDYNFTDGRPRLAAWFDKVKSRLQPHFDEVHQELYTFRENFLSTRANL